MIFKLPPSSIDKKLQSQIEETASRCEQNIAKQRDLFTAISEKPDLRKILQLSEAAGATAVQAKHWQMLLLKIHSMSNEACLLNATSKLIRFALTIQNEQMSDRFVRCAFRMRRISYQEIKAKEILQKISSRITIQEARLKEFTADLTRAIIKKDNDSIHFNIIDELQEAGEQNQDDALSLYMMLKPEGSIYHKTT